jgi:hypothetical protein
MQLSNDDPPPLIVGRCYDLRLICMGVACTRINIATVEYSIFAADLTFAAIGCSWLYIVALTAIGTATSILFLRLVTTGEHRYVMHIFFQNV